MCAATKRANEREWEQDVECVQGATLTPHIKLQQVSLPALARPVNTLYCPCKMYTLPRIIQFKSGINCLSLTYFYRRREKRFVYVRLATLIQQLNNSATLGWDERRSFAFANNLVMRQDVMMILRGFPKKETSRCGRSQEDGQTNMADWIFPV